jgi:hypothetical protein
MHGQNHIKAYSTLHPDRQLAAAFVRPVGIGHLTECKWLWNDKICEKRETAKLSVWRAVSVLLAMYCRVSVTVTCGCNIRLMACSAVLSVSFLCVQLRWTKVHTIICRPWSGLLERTAGRDCCSTFDSNTCSRRQNKQTAVSFVPSVNHLLFVFVTSCYKTRNLRACVYLTDRATVSFTKTCGT